MIETNPCAMVGDGCREACPRNHLMCVAHWRMVPAPLQRAVYQALERWRRAIARARQDMRRARAEDGCTTETFRAATALRVAQQMAINAVREKLIKRDLQRQEGQDTLL